MRASTASGRFDEIRYTAVHSGRLLLVDHVGTRRPTLTIGNGAHAERYPHPSTVPSTISAVQGLAASWWSLCMVFACMDGAVIGAGSAGGRMSRSTSRRERRLRLTAGSPNTGPFHCPLPCARALSEH